MVVGRDPRAYEAVVALLYAIRRQATGGMVQQAIGAIENALLDIKAKALGVPVYELFGGPVRERIRLWSHCGTYRLDLVRADADPAAAHARRRRGRWKEVVAKGYTALKTNIFLLADRPRLHAPGFARGDYFPELNAERNVIGAIRDQLAAFREGAGPDVDILVDLNFNFKTEGFLKMARAMEPYDLFWVEIDTRSPKALHHIRQGTTIPVASGNVCSAGATTGRSSSSRRWTWRSSTRRGTGWPSP